MTAINLSPIQAQTVRPRGAIVQVTWKNQTPPPHEFMAIICPEADGGFSAFSLNYPDVISQGDSVDEAKQNIAESFQAVLESRQKHGEQMTFAFRHSSEFPPNAVRHWITVDG